MVDEFKSIRDGLFKTLSGLSVNIRGGQDEGDGEADQSESASGSDARAAKALLAAIFAKAGKSKDELVQIIAREIGLTVAAMLKEPLAQIAKHQKLQISFELVPKEESSPDSSQHRYVKKKKFSPRRKSKQRSTHGHGNQSQARKS